MMGTVIYLYALTVFQICMGSPAEGQDRSHTCQSHILQSNMTQASYSPEYITPTQQISWLLDYTDIEGTGLSS
jgi:hypothetical protein